MVRMPQSNSTTRIEPLGGAVVNPGGMLDPIAPLDASQWGWTLAYGILLIVIAVVLLANPVFTGIATGLMLGILLLFYGMAALVAAFRSLSGSARWIELTLGLLAIAAGLFALFNPVAGAISLLWAIGIWLMVAGGFQIAYAWRARRHRGWWLFLGVLDVVLGLILGFATPALGIALLAFIVTLSFLMRGVFLVLLALRMRRGAF